MMSNYQPPMTPTTARRHRNRRQNRWASRSLPLLSLVLSLSLSPAPSANAGPLKDGGVTRAIVVLRRSAESFFSVAASPFDDGSGANFTTGRGCDFDGGELVLSHPMSLKPSDRFHSTSELQLRAMELIIDAINISPRCGVSVSGRRYSLTLSTYGDDSSKEKAAAIASTIVSRNNTEFFVGPYSSGLTGMVTPIADEAGKVMVAGGAASTSVFRDRPKAFGTFPPTSRYLEQAILALREAGSATVVGMWEDASFTRGVCAALPGLVESQRGMELIGTHEVPAGPTAEHLDPLARYLSRQEVDPDVVVTCVYEAGCAEWVGAMRRSGWSPRAQVFTVCVGMETFESAVGNDAEYMIGVSPWDDSLPLRDAVTGWSAREFSELFFDSTTRTATYHAASAASSVGILVQAVERVDTLDADKVATELREGEFTTLYGSISFDENGQSKAPALVLQYDSELDVQTVYPPAQKSGDLRYPMPTWAYRDCARLSPCASVGNCTLDGTCACDDPSRISVGTGRDAECRIIPQEDMTYIISALKGVGIALVAIQGFLSVTCALWTVRHQRYNIVRISQPVLLVMVCFGTFILSLAIIPGSVEGTYRHIRDPATGMLTDEPNPDVWRADAACMAFPWLVGIGFAVVFSALFAKIWRVKKLVHSSQSFRRKRVEIKDVAAIMVAVCAAEIAMLLAWQLIDPLRWKREVLSVDADGYATSSVGRCSSDHQTAFLVPLVAFNFGCLVYALYLCYVTRKFPDEFAEGKWITASVISIFQILTLAVPIIFLVQEDASAFYFVRAAILFLMSSTVTLLIFGPKVYSYHFSEGGRTVHMPSLIRTMSRGLSPTKGATSVVAMPLALQRGAVKRTSKLSPGSAKKNRAYHLCEKCSGEVLEGGGSRSLNESDPKASPPDDGEGNVVDGKIEGEGKDGMPDRTSEITNETSRRMTDDSLHEPDSPVRFIDTDHISGEGVDEEDEEEEEEEKKDQGEDNDMIV